MKLKVIIPVAGIPETEIVSSQNYLKKWVDKDTEISVSSLKDGPKALESDIDTAYAIPYIAKVAVEAEEEGYDGILISCFDDPGLEAIREIINIPIIGAFNSSMSVCVHLLGKICIVSPSKICVPSTERKVDSSIYKKYVKGIRSIETSIEDIITGDITNKLYNLIELLYQEGEYQGVVLGCTSFYCSYKDILERLQKRGIDFIVIEPSKVAILELEQLVKLGIRHSKKAYPYRQYEEIINNL
ncbi:aspartate/glutamate racemase family protein [Clostridiaceae bacterium M8S5]|nr:aspartate/glutamate racemase family protein [Clostridiaceae bacterium M8S5]